MPIRLIDPAKPIKWVHPKDDPKNPTVFNVVALSEGKARELRNEFITGPNVKAADINAFHVKMFLQCVKSIDNVVMPGDVAPRSIHAPEDIRMFLDVLPAEYSQAIYAAVQNLSELDAGTVKNSEESHV